METHFDAAIVGSGFGGSVMAHRLSAAGLRVCLLERGRSYPPGSFARSPREMNANFWDPDRGRFGMFDVWAFRGAQAVVSSGLGGGSLIYANVLIRKPERWFVQEQSDGGYRPWPVTRDDLEPHYDQAERILGAQRYPFDAPPYNQTPKTQALQEAAGRLGLPWELPQLAVTFAAPGQSPVPAQPFEAAYPNLHAAPRQTCRLCGECDIGCNYGSKNTLDYNYLSLAQQSGAELRTLCEVKRLAPRSQGGYEIEYLHHDRERQSATRQTITAERLVLAAGTLGSNYLLLRNRERLPGLSPRLGEHFSTNGDLLSFALCARQSGNGAPRTIDPQRGPVITSAIVGPDELDHPELKGRRGFYLEDAGYPDFVNWIAETTNVGGTFGRALQVLWGRFTALFRGTGSSEIDDQISQLIGAGRLSSSSMPLLAMGRDVPAGTMSLARREADGKPYLQIDWPERPESPYFREVTAVSRQVAEAIGADFVQNPLTQFLRQIITVHPLGGCAMGAGSGDGVVDAYGEVFGHPGLYVADGSVMPGPVGPNPSLTIAALAERFAERIVEKTKG